MKMPRRKNKSVSARFPAQSPPAPEPEVLHQLEFDSFISMDLPVCPTISKCRNNYLAAIADVNAKLQKTQSGPINGICKSHNEYQTVGRQYLAYVRAAEAELQKTQSGTTDGTYSPDPPADTTTASPDPPADTATACTKLPASAKGDVDSHIDPENRNTNPPDNEPAPPMHTEMLPQHPPLTIPFSNLPQLSSTPASSSYEEVCATNLQQQDPASSSPRIIQASSPLLALQTAGGNNHAARSIFVGDQAWPPIRPPIHPPRAGTRDAEFSQVAPDIGVEAQRARDAFREPQEFRSLGETHAAASACFASLMARVRPNTQSGLSMTSTRPSAPAPSETAGRIVSAGFQDPEASVTTCEVCPRPAPSRMPRTITRAEMNRRWRLNDPPARSRILRAADETGGTLGAVTSTPPARPADIKAAVGSGSEKVPRQAGSRRR